MASGCSAAPATPSIPGVRDAGGPILLLDLEGRSIDFRELSSGGIAVAIFARSDCPISNRHAPDVREIYERFHARGVKFFLIYVDPSENPKAIREHLAEYGYPCQALRDPEHRLVAHVGATVTPEAAVFNGSRRAVYRGRINDRFADLGEARTVVTTHDLSNALEAVLGGERVAVPVTNAVGCLIVDLRQ